ncbi:MAG: bifunctional riboflavin kinase/FAD synthetase [Nocardioidaceae bacterium]|nr:bifunctional riboflavin kinase/FAD synthetase [Nocardioidaceae bacterium]
MQVWRTLSDVPTDLGRCAVTIGNFDGMHLGHQHVVGRTHEVAVAVGADAVVAVTFDPHPMAVLRPEHAPPTLTTTEERLRLLGQAGVDGVWLLPFSREIASWTPTEFVERVLVTSLHAKAVVVGGNFRFGNRAAGDCNLLRAEGNKHDFVLEEVDLDGGPQVWSSTYVRTCLAAGDVAGAAEALGRPFTVRGTVVEGDKRGRGLGYPTANVPMREGAAAPAEGVYAGRVRVLDGPDAGSIYPAAVSVGANPTFAGERMSRVESYVLDRTDLELYGREIEVGFEERLRPMLRFDSVEALLAAMADDVERSRAILDA